MCLTRGRVTSGQQSIRPGGTGFRHPQQFAGAYGKRGKTGWPPGRLALVTVFQMAEDLTDRQAAEAVRTRIDWKYALGLDLADPGFDDSILSEFRARVVGGGLDQVVLDALLERLAAGGLGSLIIRCLVGTTSGGVTFRRRSPASREWRIIRS